MFCGNCGHPIPNGLNVCPNCSATVTPKVSANSPLRNSGFQRPVAPVPPPANFSAPQKKKLSKNAVAGIIITCVFAVILSVFAFYLIRYSTEVKKAPEAASAPADLVTVNDNEASVGEVKEADNSSESLEEMVIVIGGVEYQFPLKISDFTANGWIHSDTEFVLNPLAPNETKTITLNLGEDSMDVVLFNPTSSTLEITECFIAEISSNWVDFILAKNITTHTSTRAEIIEAYGTPAQGSNDVYLYYGNVDDFVLDYPIKSTTPIVTLKFDENCVENGAKDTDVLLYVNVQWYNPDVEELYGERSAE